MNIFKIIWDFFSNLTVEKIIQFLLFPQLPDWLVIIKFLFVIVSLALFGFIIFALLRTTWLKKLILWDWKEFLTYKPFGLEKIEKKWQKIKSRLESQLEPEWKLAIIEADEIMEKILDRMGFDGKNLEEKLEKLSPTSLSNVEGVSQAHKIRNNIVHDPNYKLNQEEARKTIAIFEKALIDLQVL